VPRQIRVAPGGDIFIAETDRGRIRVLRAKDGATRPERGWIFADGLDGPFGMAFFPPGSSPRWLYVAENNRVVRFAYQDGDTTARSRPEVVIPELSPTTGGHTTRDLVFSLDGKRMFVSVGSQSNVAEGIGKKSADGASSPPASATASGWPCTPAPGTCGARPTSGTGWATTWCQTTSRG